MLLDLDAGKAAALIQPLIDSPAGSVPIRERLKAFAAAAGAADLMLAIHLSLVSPAPALHRTRDARPCFC